MWVYQQTGMPAHLPEAVQQLPTGEAALLPQPQKTICTGSAFTAAET